MPKRNYNQSKRQREASRDEKKALKLQRKLDRTTSTPSAAGADEPGPTGSPSKR